MATGTLTGQTIAATYKSLLKITGSANEVLHATTLKVIEDGDGNASPIQLAQNRLEIVPVANHANAFKVSQADGTQILNINSTTPAFTLTGALTVGADGAGHDVIFYSDTADAQMKWNDDQNTGLVIGENGSGSDVKFFGDSAGQYMLWDQSADELVLAGDTKLSFHDAAGGENIIATSDGVLTMNSATSLTITTPTLDLTSTTKVDFDSPILDMVTQGTTIELKQQVDALAFDGASDNILNIDATNNRVGIGTASPTTLFEIVGEGADVTAQISCHSSTETHAPILLFSKSDNNESSPTLVDDNALLGVINFQGMDANSGGSYIVGASVIARINGTPAADDMPTDLEFWTNDGAASSTQRMTIKESGFIGIGTAVPTTTLHVKQTADSKYGISIENTDADNPRGLEIDFSGYNGNTGDSDFYLLCFNSDDSVRARIDGLGNYENVSGTAIAAISDARLKENVADYTGGLAIVNALKPKTFTWKAGVERGMEGTRYGFIAQEVVGVEGYKENMNLARKGKYNEVDGEAIKNLCPDGDLYKSHMSARECILISAIQELSDKVTALENA